MPESRQITTVDDFITLDVLVLIISHLGPKDAQRFFMTCKVFYTLFNESSLVWDTQLQKFKGHPKFLLGEIKLTKSWLREQYQKLDSGMRQYHRNHGNMLLFLRENQDSLCNLVHPVIIQCWHILAQLQHYHAHFDKLLPITSSFFISYFKKYRDIEYALVRSEAQ